MHTHVHVQISTTPDAVCKVRSGEHPSLVVKYTSWPWRQVDSCFLPRLFPSVNCLAHVESSNKQEHATKSKAQVFVSSLDAKSQKELPP